MTTHFSDVSAASSFTKQKAALFKKAREKFNLSNSIQHPYAENNSIQEQSTWNKLSEMSFLTNKNYKNNEHNSKSEMTPPNRKRFGVADFSSLP